MSTKFGLLIELDLLNAVTSTKTKPEVVLSGRVQHLKIDMMSYFVTGWFDMDEIWQLYAELR